MGGGKGKINRMNQALPYVNLGLHKWYAFTPCTNTATICIPFVYNKKIMSSEGKK